MIVGKGSNGHGNEVRCAVEKHENTGNVSLVAEVSRVISIDGSLVLSLHGGGEVGNIGSYVGGLVAQLEVEVLIGCGLKRLVSKGNALNGYGQTNVCAKICAGSKLFGNVKGVNFLNGAVNDGSITALDLLHSGVGLNGTGNLNGHTNLNAQFLYGILINAVAVVTAGHAGVSKEEVVVLVACILGVDGNYDTLNCNDVTLCGCQVLSVRVYLVLGHGQLKGNLLGGAVACLNGSGQLVGNLFGRFLVNVNNDFAVCRCANGNLVSIDRPIDLIGNTADHNLRYDLEVNGGNGEILFVEALYVCCRACEIVGNGGGGFGGSFSFFFFGVASCQHGAQKCRCEQKCK